MANHIKIKYKNKLRNLEYEETPSLCVIKDSENKQYRALCTVFENDTNIDNIELEPNFDFFGDPNISIKFSPLAFKQKNNLKNLESINYSKYNLYILENSYFC